MVAEEVAAVVQMKTSQTTLIIKHFPTITDHNVYVYVYLCCGSICVYLYDVYLCVLCIYVCVYMCVHLCVVYLCGVYLCVVYLCVEYLCVCVHLCVEFHQVTKASVSLTPPAPRCDDSITTQT